MIHQIELTESVLRYVRESSLRDDDVLRALREETSKQLLRTMQIPPEQGQLLQLLARSIRARRTLEVGVFTGYSTLCVARALPPGGAVVAIDINQEWIDIARRYWEAAGVEDRIRVRLGDARDVLKALLEEPDREPFDFAFIDADKESYDVYYEYTLRLLRPGGLVVLDNVLWSGLVTDPNYSDEATESLRKINQKLLHDARVFAYIGGIGRYHTALDTPDRVDQASLQNHGEYALRLARRLGNRGEIPSAGPDSVFFNVGGALFTYSARASRPLTAIAVALWIAAFVWGMRAGRLRARLVFASAGLTLVGLIAAAAATVLVTLVAAISHDEFRRVGDTYQHTTYFIGIACVSLAISTWLALTMCGRWGALNVAAGASFGWALLSATFGAVLPGASYALSWPLLGLALGWFVLLPRGAGALRTCATLILQALPTIVLVVPLLLLVFEGLTLMLALVGAAIVALSVGSFVLHLDALVGDHRRVVPALFGAVGIGCIVKASWPTPPSSEYPRQNSMLYALDADTQKAIWASSDAALDPWTRSFLSQEQAFGPLPAFMPSWDRDFWRARAPVLPLSPPILEVRSDTVSDGVRTLRLRVASSRGARAVVLVVRGARVLGYRLDGFNDSPDMAMAGGATPAEGDSWDLWLEGPDIQESELDVSVAAGRPITLRALDRSDGLPPVRDPPIAPRATEMIPAAALDIEIWSHTTFVGRSITLAGYSSPAEADEPRNGPDMRRTRGEGR